MTAAADLPAVGGELGGGADGAAIKAAIESFGPVDAVGHRVVHGGTLYTAPVLVTGEVRQRLESLTDLAPLHQPKSLAALDAVSSVLPDTPAVACFDTAFHATIPDGGGDVRPARPSGGPAGRCAATGSTACPTPTSPAARPSSSGPRRAPTGLRVVTCHLGAGASLAAVHGGRSVDTTMGFTPLDGLVMATRSGSVDPGLVLWLEEHAHMPSRELAATLENRSGLARPGRHGRHARGAVPCRRGRRAGGPRPRRLPAPAPRVDRLDGRRDGRPRRAGLHRRRRRELPGDPLPRRRRPRLPRRRRRRVTQRPRQEARGDDWEITARGTRVRTFVIAAREDKQIAAEVRSVLR